MTENVSNLSLHKIKQDILIVFHAREILIPENRSNASVNQAGLLTLINNVFPLLNSTVSWRHSELDCWNHTAIGIALLYLDHACD